MGKEDTADEEEQHWALNIQKLVLILLHLREPMWLLEPRPPIGCRKPSLDIVFIDPLSPHGMLASIVSRSSPSDSPPGRLYPSSPLLPVPLLSRCLMVTSRWTA